MRDSPVFCALLTPHRALSVVGIRWIVGIYLLMTLIPAFFFFFNGAWPIVGFLGFDVLVLGWALSVSQKGGKAYEEITLWADEIKILQVSAKGKQVIKRLNPFWVRMNILRDYDNQITNIILKTRKHTHEIGSFLNPHDKTSFAHAFAHALARVKN